MIKESKVEQKQLKPMYLAESLLWFGFWSIVMFFSIYVLVPVLKDKGLSDLEQFSIAMTLPMILMFLTAIIIYKLQNKSFQGFFSRYRLSRFGSKDIIWGVVIAIFAFLGFGLFSLFAAQLVFRGLVPVPKNLPLLLTPEVVFNNTFNRLVAGEIVGNWRVVLVFFAMMFFNIAGEELFWRGYILPRQELAFGKKTWLIHGVLWTLFHSFKWWEMLSLLPVCLLTAFIAQKRKSTWTSFIAHFLINGVGGGLMVFILAVLGKFIM